MDPLGRAYVPEVARVEAQLAELWREASSGSEPVTRACTLNLVVACDDGSDDLVAATNLVARVAESEPGRAIVAAFPEPEAETAGLEVYVSAHCHRGEGGGQICSEQVTMEARGAGRDLIPATVLQLLVADLPVFTVWRRGELGDEPLLRGLLDVSDRFIVNSASHDDPVTTMEALERIVSSEGPHSQAGDFTWDRLEPWREALASFVDAPRLRPALEKIKALAITASGPAGDGKLTAAAACLAGWMASRLGWKPRGEGRWLRRDGGDVDVSFALERGLPPGEVAAVRIETELKGSPAVFDARRVTETSDVVYLSIEAGRISVPPRRIKLPARDEAALLCGMLQRRGDDPIFDDAVRSAARMVRRR